MPTFGSSETTFGPHLSGDSTQTPYTGVRCPCCASKVEQLPRLWTIEPSRVCRRSLALVRFPGRPRTYRLHHVLDVGGAIYGLSTSALITAFILSEMNARTFAKIITILLFVFGSLLLVDGVLGFSTRIDRTWSVVRRGGIAKLIRVGKAAAGMTAFGLVLVGLTL